MIGEALRKLPPALAEQFKVVLTTDPARDTPHVLRMYLDRFNQGFIGLTGSQEAIDAAQVSASLPSAKKGTVRPDGNYEVGHSAFVVAYTKDNLGSRDLSGGTKDGRLGARSTHSHLGNLDHALNIPWQVGLIQPV